MIAIEKILEKQQEWQAVSVEDEPVISAIVSESLAKCADAIAVLSENLRGVGYIWVSSESTPVHELEENIQRIEAKTGLTVPKVLIEFWKNIGGVSLVDLENYQHIDFWNRHQIFAPKGFADGLYVEACNREWAAFICQDYDDWKEYQRQDESERFLLSLSPDGFHKDNISGGMPYGVLAESSWKPIWQNFSWSGQKYPVTALSDPPDFLAYLRTTILECAGFPALLGIPAFERIKENLLQGVPEF